jgi:phosphoglucomutase
MSVHPGAGKPAPPSALVDVPQLVGAYSSTAATEPVSFGTSGHRGSSFKGSFNEAHIAAMTQAICEYRKEQGISGPLFLGIDTHALSEPARVTALGVLAAHGVDVRVDADGGYTPTPVISHAILRAGKADGIVITPSHNPPEDGGFKYNPPHGGPADTDVTDAIQRRANALLTADIERREPAPTSHDYIDAYVSELDTIVDMDAIKGAGIRIGVDPLGGAGVAYWGPIAERFGLDIEVVNDVVDPTFGFMTLDRDGKIRMDCSSPYAMAS